MRSVKSLGGGDAVRGDIVREKEESRGKANQAEGELIGFLLLEDGFLYGLQSDSYLLGLTHEWLAAEISTFKGQYF